MNKVPIIQKNARYRLIIWSLTLATMVLSLTFGLLTGKDFAGNTWDWFVTFAHIFVIVFAAWRLYEVPQRLQLSDNLIRFSKPVFAHIVIEQVPSGDGGCVYDVFVRGCDLPGAFFSNWRGRVLEPYSSDIYKLIERDLEAQVYFSSDRKPRLVKLGDLMLEIDSVKEVRNRWNG